jgi:hypothetical protein
LYRRGLAVEGGKSWGAGDGVEGVLGARVVGLLVEPLASFWGLLLRLRRPEVGDTGSTCSHWDLLANTPVCIALSSCHFTASAFVPFEAGPSDSLMNAISSLTVQFLRAATRGMATSRKVV